MDKWMDKRTCQKHERLINVLQTEKAVVAAENHEIKFQVYATPAGCTVQAPLLITFLFKLFGHMRRARSFLN